MLIQSCKLISKQRENKTIMEQQNANSKKNQTHIDCFVIKAFFLIRMNLYLMAVDITKQK